MITELPYTYRIGQRAEVPNEVMQRYPEGVERCKERMKETLLRRFESDVKPENACYYALSFSTREKPSDTEGYTIMAMELLAEIQGG